MRNLIQQIFYFLNLTIEKASSAAPAANSIAPETVLSLLAQKPIMPPPAPHRMLKNNFLPSMFHSPYFTKRFFASASFVSLPVT